MHIERVRPLTLRVTLSVYEIAALVAAGRWALDGGEGELTADARDQLAKVLESYDTQTRAAAAAA